jgi:hypothetical protein
VDGKRIAGKHKVAIEKMRREVTVMWVEVDGWEGEPQ